MFAEYLLDRYNYCSTLSFGVSMVAHGLNDCAQSFAQFCFGTQYTQTVISRLALGVNLPQINGGRLKMNEAQGNTDSKPPRCANPAKAARQTRPHCH